VQLEHIGVIGNCQYAALVDRTGSVVFCCLPRFDSEPVFSTMLDEKDGGSFRIGPADGSPGVQRYLDNTNVLETRFTTPEGSFRVLDFAPRFLQFERTFRPTKLVRIVEPLSGTPRIKVTCDPRLGWSKKVPSRDVGSHHVKYLGFGSRTSRASRSRSPRRSTSCSPGATRSRSRCRPCVIVSWSRRFATGGAG
jgi:GH15 family glucan-1,4-alpha-glucosidase